MGSSTVDRPTLHARPLKSPYKPNREEVNKVEAFACAITVVVGLLVLWLWLLEKKLRSLAELHEVYWQKHMENHPGRQS